VALAANALLTVPELLLHLDPGQSGTQDQTDSMERAINAASDIIQAHLGRSLITPGSDLVEYHTVMPYQSEILTLDWPISSVATVHEDVTRAYGASALLVVDTDYVVSKPGGKLIRVAAGAGEATWSPGFRAVKVTYKPGWTVAALPARFKDAALFLCALLYKEQTRGNWGVSTITDAAGNFTRLSVDHLPASVRGTLDAETGRVFGATGERDS
jgi:hypothetical protein